MTKFVELDLVIPVENDKQHLVGIKRKTVFVNADNISHFEPIRIAYPQKVDHQNYYSFYTNIIDRQALEQMDFWDLNSPSVLKIQFENMSSYIDTFIGAFRHLGFISGVAISFKPGCNPLGYDEPVYAATPANELAK